MKITKLDVQAVAMEAIIGCTLLFLVLAIASIFGHMKRIEIVPTPQQLKCIVTEDGMASVCP